MPNHLFVNDVAGDPLRALKVGMDELPGFQTIRPNQRLNLDDFKLPDGTPLVGRDGQLIPPARSLATIVNAGTRVYSYRFDEAMRDNWVQARAMRRDAFLRGLMEERILPTINRRWHLAVDDDRDPCQAYVRDALTKCVAATPKFDAFKRALLDATWFGRAGAQWNLLKDDDIDGMWRIGKWDPIHGDSMQFTFDGVPAVLMDGMTAGWYTNHGATQGPGGDIRPTDRGGSALVLQRPYWRDRFAVHQHILEKADFFEGELAGSVQGLGIRGLVYWHYVVRTDALTWMLAYMQAVGQMDLLIFNYPASDAAGKLNAETNAQKVIGKAAMAVPRNPTQNWPAVEQIPMNAAGLKALQELVADYFDRHIERLIVGQSMSSGADRGDGLGGTGRADFARACVPVEGSEILTRGGFKSPEDVQVGDEVLAYDAETDKCRWTPLLKKSFYEDAEVVRMWTEQNRFEAVCTPDHSWAVEKTKYASDFRNLAGREVVPGPRGASRLAAQERYLAKACDLKKRENIVLAAPEVDQEDSLLTPTEAAILGWVITDGTIRRYDGRFSGTRYSVAILQSKEENFAGIRELMVKYTGAVHETVVETKSRTFPMTGQTCDTLPQHMWFLPREHGTRLLKKVGFVDRSCLPGIVTRLSHPARAAMLDAMIAGDGCVGALTTFTNTDPHVIEALEILCALEGIATGYTRAKKNDPRYRQCFDKTLKTGRYAYGLHIQTEAAGRSDVWCPTTKYGTWVMRQNGRVLITGNTKDEIIAYDTSRLDDTLTTDVVGPLKRFNFPWAKFPVRFESILPDLEAKDKVDSGQVLIATGVPIKVDEFREAAGYSRPEVGDETVGGMQPGMGMGMPGMPGAPLPGGIPPELAAQGMGGGMPPGMLPPGQPPPMGPPGVGPIPPGLLLGGPAMLPQDSGPVFNSAGGANWQTPARYVQNTPPPNLVRKWSPGGGVWRYSPPMPMGPTEYSRTDYAAGKHGTPQWNPAPHPEHPDPVGAVAARNEDPLWQHHRGVRAYDGQPAHPGQLMGRPSHNQAVLRSQIMHDRPDSPWHQDTVPEGFKPWGMATSPGAVDVNHLYGEVGQEGHFSFRHPSFAWGGRAEPGSNSDRYSRLWGWSGNQGRRPWYDAIFPLQDMDHFGDTHDPYKQLSNAVRSGNRHALPPLVDLLRRRDNPAGWSPVWTHLAKAMAERVGDLPPQEVHRRGLAIADATKNASQDPGTHAAIAEAIRANPQDPTPLFALHDHMGDHGLETYAQMLRAELANLPNGQFLQEQARGQRKGGRGWRYDAGAGAPAAAGPAMGYPGGGNTYIPSFGRDSDRPQDMWARPM